MIQTFREYFVPTCPNCGESVSLIWTLFSMQQTTHECTNCSAVLKKTQGFRSASISIFIFGFLLFTVLSNKIAENDLVSMSLVFLLVTPLVLRAGVNHIDKVADTKKPRIS